MFVKTPGLRQSEVPAPARVEVLLIELTINPEGGRFRGKGTMEVRMYRHGDSPEIVSEPIRTSLYDTEIDVGTAAQLIVERRRNR
jgi:hypothetical protein